MNSQQRQTFLRLKFDILSKDEFSTAIKLPVSNGMRGQWEQFTDCMLESKAVAGLEGVESALNFNFDKELPSSDFGWDLQSWWNYIGFRWQQAQEGIGSKYKSNASVGGISKGMTCRSMINKEKQADSNFFDEKTYKLVADHENRLTLSPNNWMVGTEILMKPNKVKLKNANVNRAHQKLKITHSSQSKKLN